jgi:glycosyltransferase involved in cell wall biosynthesis/tetratricopeptide (TPR) repeat protein
MPRPETGGDDRQEPAAMDQAYPAPDGTLIWVAPFYNRSGYGVGARASVCALHRAGLRIRVLPVNEAEPGIDDCDMDLIRSLEATPVVPPVTAVISHVPSLSWLDLKLPEPSLRIMNTTFDSSAQGNLPPADWMRVFNQMDQVWVMTDKEREVFQRAGLPPEKVQTVYWPHPWLENPSVPPVSVEAAGGPTPFRFLSIAMFQPRRRWDTLIEAYLEEFRGESSVELYLKVNFPSWHPIPGRPRQDLYELVRSLQAKTGSSAAIRIDEELGTRRGIVDLMDSCSTYVSTDTASTAPISEARARQRLVIAPEGLGLDGFSDCSVVIPVDPDAKTQLTPEMLLYQPHHKGTAMPMLHVHDVRAALRRAFEMSKDDRHAVAVAASPIPGPSRTTPMMVQAIEAGWRYKNSLKIRSPRRIAWEGPQFVQHSLALVNRELCLRLIASGQEISILPIDGGVPLLRADSQPQSIRERMHRPLAGPADVHVRHQWPPNFEPPAEGRWIVIQPWEFGALPAAWVEPMRDMVDEVWVPSAYVRECYLRSGIPADRVFVVPNGVDTGRFRPGAAPLQLSTSKRFKFLFVGGTIYRKGIDVLLDGYSRAFTDRDDVCLVIKDMGGDSFYKGQTAKAMIEEYRSKPGAPEIEYLEHALDDAEMAGLYTACDCLVHPYRGEGFGLPIAEAMACGLPVVVTGHGAALDFCSSESAYLIPAVEIRSAERRIGDIATVDHPWLAEPDREELARVLGSVVENPEQARAKGRAGRSRIEAAFTWDHAAAAVLERVEALSHQPIRRFEAQGVPTRQRVPGLTSIVVHLPEALPGVRRWSKRLRKHTRESHEFIAVVTSSSSGIAKRMKTDSRGRGDWRFIETTPGAGFAQAINQAIEAAAGEYLAVLEPEAGVSDQWLFGMIRCLNSSAEVGLVAPLSAMPAHDDEWGKTLKRLSAGRRIPAHRGGGGCTLLRRALLDEIGMLDPSLDSPATAMEDLRLRAELAGYHNLIAGDVFLSPAPGAGEGERRESDARNEAHHEAMAPEKWQSTTAGRKAFRRFSAWSAAQHADELYQKGQTDEALRKLIEAVAQSPEDPGVYHRLAQLLIDCERFQDGLDAIGSAPSPSRPDPRRLGLMGACLEGLERLDEADGCADQALAIDPGSAPALDLKGVIALKRGDLSLAADSFRRSVEADPGYGPSYTHLGVLKWNGGAADDALDDLAKGFVMAPTHGSVIKTYHSALVSSGRFELAEKLFLEALGHYPSNRRITFLFIDILIRQGKHSEAMGQIEHAMVRFGMDEGMLSAALAIRQKVGVHEGAPGPHRLTLCMIVKNEQAHLARCLDSVKAVVDEIVLVDTGSTDRTKDIARAFGAKVVDHSWADDFSEARNLSLRHATGDWVLALDADEVVSADDHPGLRALLRAKKPRDVAYAMTTRNYTDQSGSRGWTPNLGEYRQEECGKGWFPSTKVRLFRNDQRIRFENAVHETVEGTIRRCGIPILACPIPVHHYGRIDPAAVLAKGRAYFSLGKRKVEETCGNVDALRELAIQAGEIGEYDEAVQLWKTVLERVPHDARAWMNMGFAHLSQKNFKEAQVASKRALELDPALREAALNCANCELMIGSARRAASLVEQVLSDHPEYPPAMGLAAVAYCVDGQEAKGLELFRQLRTMRFDCEEVIREQASSLAAHGRAEGARLLEGVVAKVKGARTDGHACMAAH